MFCFCFVLFCFFVCLFFVTLDEVFRWKWTLLVKFLTKFIFQSFHESLIKNVHSLIFQKVDYLNDASPSKKSWFQMPVKSVWIYEKRLHIYWKKSIWRTFSYLSRMNWYWTVWSSYIMLILYLTLHTWCWCWWEKSKAYFDHYSVKNSTLS